jgi:hypothetical protein
VGFAFIDDTNILTTPLFTEQTLAALLDKMQNGMDM